MEAYIKDLNLYFWSTVEKTALADAEVEYMDHTSNTIYVAFKIKNKTRFFRGHAVLLFGQQHPGQFQQIKH